MFLSSSVGDVDDVPDEHTGGDSSKSNSVTSEHSVHSVGVSASSQSSSTNSLPAGEYFRVISTKNILISHGIFLGMFPYISQWESLNISRLD